MRPMRLTSLRVGMLLCGAIACTREAEGRVRARVAVPMWAHGTEQERRITVTKWDTVRAITGPTLDTLLKGSFLMAVDRNRYYVYSSLRRQLIAIAPSGKVEWTSSSGAFGNVRDMRLGSSGEVLLIDTDGHQIHVVSASGKATKIPLEQTTRLEKVVRLQNGKFLVYSPDAAEPFTVAGSSGQSEAHLPVPWKGYSDMLPLARQGTVVSDQSGRRWAFLFAFGDGWFGFDNTRPEAFLGRFIEHTDFPQIIIDSTRSRESMRLGKPTLTSIGGYINKDTMSVLFGGRSENRRRLIDRYLLGTGEYVETYLLPSAPDAIAAQGANVVVFSTEPHAALVTLRPRRP